MNKIKKFIMKMLGISQSKKDLKLGEEIVEGLKKGLM